MTIWEAIGGAMLLAAGVFRWMFFLGASAFRAGFGDGPIPAYLYLIPAAVVFGGPFLMWYVLPQRRRARRGRR